MRELSFDNKLPYIYYIFTYDKKKTDTESTKFSTSYRFLFALEGTIEIIVDNIKYVLNAGDAILLLPGTVYITIFKKSNTQICNLFFGFEPLNTDSVNFAKTVFYHPTMENTTYCKKHIFKNAIFFNELQYVSNIDVNLVFSLLDEYKLASYNLNLRCHSIFFNILMRIYNYNSTEFKVKHKIIYDIQRYIMKNIESKITCENISKSFGYHPNYLNQIFKTNLNITLNEFLLQNKMKHALRLLIESDLSITQIAMQLNFVDSSHFIRIFKKSFKMTPNAYRKLNDSPNVP